MAKSKNAGRPAGSRNLGSPVVAMIPSACPHCKCTERESVRIIRERQISGEAPNGQPRTHIVWRRVRCRGCRAYFIEQEHQNRVGGKKECENPDSFSESAIPQP